MTGVQFEVNSSGVATDSAWPDPVSGASSTGGAGRTVMSINERDIRAVEDLPSPSALRGVTANEYRARGSSPVSVALGSVVLTVMASESCSEMAVLVSVMSSPPRALVTLCDHVRSIVSMSVVVITARSEALPT